MFCVDFFILLLLFVTFVKIFLSFDYFYFNL